VLPTWTLRYAKNCGEGGLPDLDADCNREMHQNLGFSVNFRWVERFSGSDLFQFGSGRARFAGNLAIETRIAAGVAGTSADLLDHEDERVLITVRADFHDSLDVAGSGSLVPKFLSRT